MRFTIRNFQDFWCGLLFVSLGVLAIYLAWNYPMGSALAMGPGYFPTWLGGIMIAFGVAVGALSLRRESGPGEDLKAHTWAFRPWIVLTLALAMYALLMDAGLGFVPSLMVLTTVCALAHKDVRWGETIVLSIILTAACVAIFYYGLEMPFRLFWWSD
jgi:hypothetical protein